MSDDKIQDATPKQKVDMSKLDAAYSEPDDQDLYDDDELLQTAIDAVDDESEHKAPEPGGTDASPSHEPQAEIAADKDAQATEVSEKATNVVDLASHKPGDLKLVTNPELTTDVRKDAEAMRRMYSSVPHIVGKDAGLVKYDSTAGRVVPKDQDSADTLRMLGDNAEIGVAYAGDMRVTPLRYNPEKVGFERNPTKSLGRVPSREDLRRADLRKIQMEDGLKDQVRRARTPATVEEGSEENRRRLGHQQDQEQDKSQPPMTAGAAAVRMLDNGLQKGFAALWRLLKSMFSAVGRLMATPFNNAKPKIDSQTQQSDKARTKVDANHAQTAQKTESYSQPSEEAGESLLSKIDQRKAALTKQADDVTQGYHAEMTKQAKVIGESLGVHKAGASIIRSENDYNTMLESASPDQKTEITNAQKTIERRSAHLRDQVQSVTEHRDMGLLPMEDRAEIVGTMQANLSKPYALTKMEAAAFQHASNPYNEGKSAWATVSSSTKQTQAHLTETKESLDQQQAILQVRRQPQPEAAPATPAQQGAG